MNSPVQQLILESVPLLTGQLVLLRRVSAGVSAARGEFVAQWRAGLEQDTAHSTLTRWRSLDALNSATAILSDGLDDKFSSLENYLQAVADWSADLYDDGLDYNDQCVLYAAYRRALLPLILREFAAGPAMGLVFQALDAHERAVTRLSAVMGIERAHAQLTEGVHQRSVGRLTAGLTHVLNNSMAVILGRAQLAEEQITEENAREELRAIQTMARAGAESLKRLQQFALERDGDQTERLDVNTIINQVIQLTRFRWRDDAQVSGITIDVVKDLESVPPVQGQAALLRDALVELILNSVEAMPLGGLVTLRTERAKDEVLIVIIDQGAGMDQVTRTRAFEPFFTTKGSGHVGLGLATVANIARQMNGVLTIESVSGQGTTVRIALPAAPQVTAVDARQARLARWASILIVDDESQIRDVAARTFLLRGFHAVAADSGADALRLFNEQGPFEVVITDLGMTEMNGFELARAIKDLNPKTIVILMTGWAFELDLHKMREAGIDRAITKPFDTEQVIQLISEALAIQEQM